MAISNRLVVKVCGMRDAQNIKEVEALGVDMIGYIFCPQSPRFVQQVRSRAGLIPDYSQERLKLLSEEKCLTPRKKTARVGVFMDDMPQNIVTRIYNFQLNFVQLHGEELPVMIENLKNTLQPEIAPNIKVIKTISVGTDTDLDEISKPYLGYVDLFLFDSASKQGGGSGNKFDWSILETYTLDVPFLLSGGISPQDVSVIKEISHPQFYGLDLNSQFEISPAVKDINKLKTFLEELKR